MEKKSFFKRSLESFGRFSKTTGAKSFFLVLACLLAVAILILSVCMTGHKEKMDDTVSLEIPLGLPEDDYNSRSRLYSADEYWSALDSEKTADMFLPLPDATDDVPETDDRIRIVRESPSGSTDFVSVATDTIIIVVLVFGGVSLFLLVLAIAVCLMGLLVKAVAWLFRCVKRAFKPSQRRGVCMTANSNADGETLEFLEFDLAERMRYVGILGDVILPPFRNESLPWNESVTPTFASTEWKDRYRIRFVFDNERNDGDLEPMLVMSSDIPVDKEFVVALSCLLSGRISREAFLEETGLSDDCYWYRDDYGNVNLVWPGRGTLWALSIFGEFSREYGYLHGEKISEITDGVVRILNGERKGAVKEPESVEPAHLGYTEADFDLREPAGYTDGDDELVDFSDFDKDFLI